MSTIYIVYLYRTEPDDWQKLRKGLKYDSAITICINSHNLMNTAI